MNSQITAEMEFENYELEVNSTKTQAIAIRAQLESGDTDSVRKTTCISNTYLTFLDY